MKKLSKNFYLSNDVVKIAKQLLGKELVVVNDDIISSGIITETEAYAGANDKASHAYNNKRTKRTEVMYCSGGVAYVYLCYGIHNLFNVVTNVKDVPHAVLIRAVLPINTINIKNSNGNGPGRVTKILGITKEFNGLSLLQNKIFILDRNIKISENNIISTTRIGIDYAQEHALLPYRFLLNDKMKLEIAKNI